MRLNLVLIAVLVLAGCSVHTEKSADNKKPERVDVKTPFGSIQVKAQPDPKETGLSVYPGARPHKDNSDDYDSANVNISNSMFGVKVVAASFESDDSPAKVLDFYRKQMKSYGPVLECKSGGHGHGHFGRHDNGKADEPVTCENGPADPNRIAEDGVELKVGTHNRQRIVGIEPQGKGTKFALVYVQLRGKEGEV